MSIIIERGLLGLNTPLQVSGAGNVNPEILEGIQRGIKSLSPAISSPISSKSVASGAEILSTGQIGMADEAYCSNAFARATQGSDTLSFTVNSADPVIQNEGFNFGG